MNEENKWYEFLDYNGIATTDEIDLVCNIAGYSVQTLSDILYARTGYETMEQYLGIEEDEDEDDA